MYEKYLNEKNEPNLFKIPVTIKTKNGDAVKLDAIIQDTKSDDTSCGTVICSHGAPGCHRDFRRLSSYLEKYNIRVISINFPGCGYTKYDEKLENDNDERMQFVQQIIDVLNLKENIIFIGHSRGSENSIKMAVKNSEITVGVILVNPIGIQPHRGAKPLIVPVILTFLWKILWLKWFSTWLQYHLYNKAAKLKIKSGDVCCVTTSLLAGLDYADVLPYINRLNDSDIKTVLIYGGKDWIVQKSISQELLDCFKDNVEIKDGGDDDITINDTLKEVKDGRKSIGIYCQNGGHFLLRDRPELISQAILAMLKIGRITKCNKL